jgi:hypothetical protein
LKPWEPQESVPRLEPPAFNAAVGDAVALPPVAPAVAVVEAAVAPGRAALVSDADDAGARPQSARHGEGALAVAPARAVAVSTPVPPSSAPHPVPASPAPAAQPVAPPEPELASAPAPGATPEAGTPGGPVRAGTPYIPEDEGCEGDEYVLTITLLEGEEPSEGAWEETPDEVPVTILLERIDADGSVEEIELEGDLGDARSLVLQLTSEGGCVQVAVAPQQDDDAAEGEPGSVPAPIAP